MGRYVPQVSDTPISVQAACLGGRAIANTQCTNMHLVIDLNSSNACFVPLSFLITTTKVDDVGSYVTQQSKKNEFLNR